MLALALVLATQAASPPDPPLLARHAEEQECWAGTKQIYFEALTGHLYPQSETTLINMADAVRSARVVGHFEIEADAPGFGPTFDRALAMLRASRVQSLLEQEGFASSEIEIRLQSQFGIAAQRDEPPAAHDRFGHPVAIRFLVRAGSADASAGYRSECW